MADDQPDLNMETMTDHEVREYLVETARALSDLALKAGEPEASALLSVVAVNLTKGPHAA